ncbi:MAG: PrsW family intramembrane metalloprotease [Coriobacteriales bacterium]|nr:PrsW family intramembrane metalloprotease [Coriobacteriales bacterium]
MIYAENILLCIAIPLAVSALFVREDARRFVVAFLIGMVVCLTSSYIDGFLNLASGMGAENTSIFISPVVEECMKLLSLLCLLVLLDPPNRTLTIFAVAIGAGFATFENCCYILTTGAESFMYVLIRGMAVGVMHVVSILALAIWFIAAKRLGAFTFSAVVGAGALPVTFHALYNLLVSQPGVSSTIGYLLPIATAFALYLIYKKVLPKFEN